MSRLEVRKKSKAQLVVDNLYEDLERRIIASPPGLCPVDMTASFLKLFHAQTCGKCVPCRIGLGVLEDMLEDVLDGKATLETLSLIERTAKAIYDSADCAIGYEAGRMVLKGLEGFREDFMNTSRTDIVPVIWNSRFLVLLFVLPVLTFLVTFLLSQMNVMQMLLS